MNNKSFNDKNHLYGRIFLALAIIMIVLVPVIMAIILQVMPEWDVVIRALATLIVFIIGGFVEVIHAGKTEETAVGRIHAGRIEGVAVTHRQRIVRHLQLGRQLLLFLALRCRFGLGLLSAHQCLIGILRITAQLGDLHVQQLVFFVIGPDQILLQVPHLLCHLVILFDRNTEAKDPAEQLGKQDEHRDQQYDHRNVRQQHHDPVGSTEAALIGFDDLHTHGEIQQVVHEIEKRTEYIHQSAEHSSVILKEIFQKIIHGLSSLCYRKSAGAKTLAKGILKYTL